MTHSHYFLDYFLMELLKMDELPYKMCGSFIKSCKMEHIQSINGTNVYFNKIMDEYFE